MSDPHERGDAGAPGSSAPATAWGSPWRKPAEPQAVADAVTSQEPPQVQTPPAEATGGQPVPDPPPAGGQTPSWPAPPDGDGRAPGASQRRRSGAMLALVIALGLLAGLAGGVAGAWLLDRSSSGGLAAPSYHLGEPSRGSTARPADSVAGLAGAVLPSVVAVLVSGVDGQGTGSGFVIDGKNGYILTNNHVVASAVAGGSITVVLNSGEKESAKIVGRDPSYDLAVIKVPGKALPALAFGDSDSVVVGDPVIAVGAPLGLQGTVTTGIVSALNRPVAAGDAQETAYINAVQTDAAINPGNSGGPLVNGKGLVIGVNSAIARAPGSSPSAQSGSIGLGFAIPSKQAERTAEQLIRSGKAVHPIIGVVLDRHYTGEGVRVLSGPSAEGAQPVTPGGPAARAGLKPGDVIMAFNGRPVTDPDELVVAIRAQSPGDRVRLTVRRGGVDREVEVTLSSATS